MERIERETYNEWFTTIRRTTTSWDYMFGGYDLDELENAILKTMKDKWENCGDEYTVSVIEIARIFDRDSHNIRDTVKHMERKRVITMVEHRKTPSGQTENRYAPKQFYDDMMADYERDEVKWLR